jgi:two-component sensor histidine kinase
VGLHENALVLIWEESGGPTVGGSPKSQGFGTVISNYSVREQFGGTLSHKWNRKGLSVELTVPIERLNQ